MTLIEHMFVVLLPHQGPHKRPSAVSTLDSQQTPSNIDHNVDVAEGGAGPRVLVATMRSPSPNSCRWHFAMRASPSKLLPVGMGPSSRSMRSGPTSSWLDVMLPDIDGFNIAERLRRDRRDIPVLFLTARDATEDKSGASPSAVTTYVTKPFSVAELVARTQAILRRAGKERNTARELLVLADLEWTTMLTKCGEPVSSFDLTATEYRLLRVPSSRIPRRVLTRSQLLDTSGATTSRRRRLCSRPTSATSARRSTHRAAT